MFLCTIIADCVDNKIFSTGGLIDENSFRRSAVQRSPTSIKTVRRIKITGVCRCTYAKVKFKTTGAGCAAYAFGADNAADTDK